MPKPRSTTKILNAAIDLATERARSLTRHGCSSQAVDFHRLTSELMGLRDRLNADEAQVDAPEGMVLAGSIGGVPLFATDVPAKKEEDPLSDLVSIGTIHGIPAYQLAEDQPLNRRVIEPGFSASKLNEIGLRNAFNVLRAKAVHCDGFKLAEWCSIEESLHKGGVIS